jgi:hypothetical protein
LIPERLALAKNLSLHVGHSFYFLRSSILELHSYPTS